MSHNVFLKIGYAGSLSLLTGLALCRPALAADSDLDASLAAYNVVWTTPSTDSRGSMPLGNGSTALNAFKSNKPVPTARDLDAVCAKFRAYYARGQFHSAALVKVTPGSDSLAPNERFVQAKELLARMAPDGTWPDIDYTDQNRTFWQVQEHANRAMLLAAAAETAGSAGDAQGKIALASAANRAITTWRERRPSNPNWWFNVFGAPNALGTAGLLLGDALSAENRAFLVRCTFGLKANDRVDKVGGGGNQIWFLSKNLLGALMARNPVWSRALIGAIYRQLEYPVSVPMEERNGLEGMQPDASFHQHNAQVQFGTYGLSFAIDLATWAVITRDTVLAMPPERVAALRSYLLEGQNWVYWRGRIDISSIGRRFSPRVLFNLYDLVRQPMADLAEIDPSSVAASRAFHARNQPNAVNDLTGFRWFWRSDYGVVRNEGFFASVRLHSAHAAGCETGVNGENLQGQRLADGATYLSTRGGEYDEIFPVWDWKRIPGITSAAAPTLEPQLPSSVQAGAALPPQVPVSAPAELPTASPIEAGGVGNGRHGCIVYQQALGTGHQAQLITARKAWFFERDRMVCLGTGIHGRNKDKAVITSVNQCLGRGPVRASVGGRIQELPPGSLRPLAAEWIEHDGLRYEFPAGSSIPLLAGIATQTGLWSNVSTAVTTPAEPQSLPVFSLIIDHGRTPAGSTYAYAVSPTNGVAAPYQILSNTPDLQAVSWGDRRCAAAFWQAGTLTWGKGHSITVASPCLIDLDGDRVSVSDPTWTLAKGGLRIDGRPVSVTLRTDPGFAGSTTTVTIPEP